jgi:dsRNA-specific ribonuclease
MQAELERLEEKLVNPSSSGLLGHFASESVYELLSQHGREHEKTFSVRVVWENQVLGEGSGRSKKQAETAAALLALKDQRWVRSQDSIVP